MTAVEALVLVLDSSMHHAWESIASALRGYEAQLSRGPARDDASAHRVAAAVIWEVAHLEHNTRHYVALLEARPTAAEPDTPAPSSTSLEELRGQLLRAHERLTGALRNLGDDDLDAPCARGMNVAEFIAMAVRHNVWHGARIAAASKAMHVAE